MKSEEDAGSVTIWIGGIKEGDDSLAQYQIVKRYWEKLAVLARNYLQTKFPQGRVHDENDALNKAFNTLFRRAKENRFPELNDRDELWRLLVVITKRKVQKNIRKESAQKQGGGNIVFSGELVSEGNGADGLDKIADAQLIRGGVVVDAEPSPEDAMCAVEELNRLLDKLADDTLRTVALLKLEGMKDEDIAVRLGFSRRSIVRYKSLIKKAWTEDLK